MNKSNNKIGLVLVLFALIIIIAVSTVLVMLQIKEDKKSNGTTNSEDSVATSEDSTDNLLDAPKGQKIYAGTTESELKWCLYENGVLEINGNGAIGNYEENSAKDWFAHKEQIKGIIIGDEVTSIGSYAFRNITAAEGIRIGDSVGFIGENAFSYCSGLKNLVFPSRLTTIEDSAFYACDGLESISIPDNVSHLGKSTFAFCDNLKTVNIGAGVSYIGSDCFNSKSVLENISVSENNKSYCSVDGVLFSKDKTKILCYPSGKTESEYTIPDGVVEIDSYCFCLNSNLETLIMPEGVIIVGKYAFGSSSGIKNIHFAESVVGIFDHAFDSAGSLVSVDLGKNVEHIGKSAFNNCKSLENINISEQNTLYSSESGVLFNSDKTTLICYPMNKQKNKYQIPDSVTGIESDAFGKCTALKSIVIGDNLSSVGKNAFKDCDSLETVYCTFKESKWDGLRIGEGNNPLNDAKKIFDYTA